MGVPGMLCSGVATGQQLGSQGSHNSGCAADSMSFIFFFFFINVQYQPIALIAILRSFKIQK